ncbi:MAG TPA: phosphomannomutase/phosphoglucomutase [Acidimicrobiales bacterium]|nr:phosphomannomutase/phosphoglucomutase [Acidimicrobiales bacterium]
MTATGTTTAIEHAGEDYPEVIPPDPRWRRVWERVRKPEAIVGFLIVAACVVFVCKELQPSQLLRNTTPAGGDMGAHVWLPDFVKRALLPHLRLTGWAPDWYDGFPALTFYFPGPIVAIAVLSYVIPYNIAFKLVTVVGLLTLPIAAWAFGRLARMRYPGAVILAVATVPFMFGREFTIYGGNIASTMAGEFCFSISLSLALLFLGLVIRGLETGRHRALAAVVLAGVGVCHILPLLFAVLGAIVLTLMRFDRHRLKWILPVLVSGGALIAVWALPFELRLPYATDMGYEKVTTYMATLFPAKDFWLFALAGVGALLSLLRRNRVGTFLTIMAVLSAVIFRVAPQYRLWNARVLPFWYVSLYLLAGVAFLEVGLILAEGITQEPRARPNATIPLGMVTLVLAMGWVNYPLHQMPFGHMTSSGKYDWLGIQSSDASFDPSWVYWNYSGYQSPTKAREKEYFALVDEMKKLGKDPAYGCGRAMWEYEPELDQMGTPDALMLLPYWTQGCIGSQEGLYYESSATTPYHFLNAAELSAHPSNPVRGLDYPAAPDVAEGVQHLQMLGVKYFMALTPEVQTQADQDSDLQLVASVGPFPVSYTTGNQTNTEMRTWKIYEVANSDEVAPLLDQPVVMTGVSGGGKTWLKASESWYLDPNRWDVLEAASGPKNWARVSPQDTSPPITPLPNVQVSHIRHTNESISFDVDQTGVPVLVKTSYFPNWRVSGGRGPYRVTPNLMVVIPTANRVTLNYGYTSLDWLSLAISILGLAGIVVLWRLRPVVYPVPRHFLGRGMASTLGALGTKAKVRGRMAASDQAILDTVFKAYDIRGTVPDQMSPDLARAVGAAFARFAGTSRILVARDMRPSGVELVRAFADGATSAGTDVVDLGLTSTDEMYFASGRLEAPGAMFTASHNPAHYNGIKLCLAGARPVGVDTGLREIKNYIVNGIAADEPVPDPGAVTTRDVLTDYVSKVRSFVDVTALRPLRVVADTANGMGGLVVPAVFDGLPFSLEVLFGELDGTFPNHPADPIQPENLVALQRRILETQADVGLAFDGDADRCFLVDDKGQPVSGSTTTALVAAAMLEKSPGATILHNLICSKAVAEIIRERGGVPVRTRVGHSYIKAVMADTDALFGGEHSGHYYFRDNYRADSGTIAALVVLEVLSKTGRPLSELRRDFERYAASGEINTEVDDPAGVIESVAEHFSGARQDRLDGLTVDLGDWWFNLRPSNTEPLLRLNLEAADTATCRARTEEVLGLIGGQRPTH